MTTHISSKQAWWLVIAIIFIWFINLEYRTLIKPDEGRYAEIPREMALSGDWVTPRLNDLKYFEKPPLQYWATATAYKVFGEQQWTSRLWTALTGLAGIVFVWLVGLKIFGREAATYAALILSSSLLYVLMSHVNTLDMGVTFFVTLGIGGLIVAQGTEDKNKQRNWMLLAWAGLALAVLSKGLMGIVLPGTAVFIYCLVQRDFSVLTRMHWIAGLSIFMLICAPWFILVMQANPEFFDKFFIYEHFTRFATKELNRYQPWYYFVPILLTGALPWTVLMFDSMWQTLRNRINKQQTYSNHKAFNPQRFLLIWAIFIYVFFSISGSKLPSYLLPMFPALALLMGKRIETISAKTLSWQVAAAIPFAIALLVAGANVGKFASTPSQAACYPDYAPWLITAACISLLGLFVGIALLRRDNKPNAILALSLSALISTQVGLSGYETVAQERSAKHIAAAIRHEVKPEIPFYSILTYEQTLAFYLKKTFTLVEFQDEMGFGIKQEPQRFVPSIAEFAQRWNTQPHALAIMPVHVYPVIQQQLLPMQIIFQDSQHIVIKKP